LMNAFKKLCNELKPNSASFCFRIEVSNTEQQRKLDDLKKESKTNGFKVLLNSQYL